MGTVYLRNTAAPNGNYVNRATTLSYADLDNNMLLFVRNDVANNMTGNFGVTGTITATSNITAYGTVSDISLKENIVQIDNSLEKIDKLTGYYYNYIGKSDRLIGVVAQEVEKTMPEIVYEFVPVGETETKKAVRYETITALLIEGIKELKKKVETLEKEISALK